jgi:hypothetical protein
MRDSRIAIFIALVAVLLAPSWARSAELRELKVLYVGDAGGRRTAAFQAFLKPNVGKVDIAPRSNVTPEQVQDYDVVLLDWHQSNRPQGTDPKQCPLGAREAWTKPTILLGSAGLNLAMVWEVKGGFG